MIIPLKEEKFLERYPIPFSKFAPNQEADVCWDNEVIVENWPHFTYKINQHGFRYDEVDKPNKICFVGCSHTFGQGMAQEEIYPELITKQLGNDWQCINVAIPASGPDAQITNLTWAINNYNIDTVVWYMSTPQRQVVKDEWIHTYVPPYVEWITDRKKAKRFQEMSVWLEETTYLHTYWQLYTIFSLIKEKNIKLYFRCWLGEFHYYIKPLLDQFGIKEFTDMKAIDRARDNSHRGPLSHQWFAEQILGVMNEV